MVIYGIKEIRKKKELLDEMIEKANCILKGDVKLLENEKEAKEKELNNVKQTIKRFIDSLKGGTKTLKLIGEELEKEINHLRIQIGERKNMPLMQGSYYSI